MVTILNSWLDRIHKCYVVRTIPKTLRLLFFISLFWKRIRQIRKCHPVPRKRHFFVDQTRNETGGETTSNSSTSNLSTGAPTAWKSSLIWIFSSQCTIRTTTFGISFGSIVLATTGFEPEVCTRRMSKVTIESTRSSLQAVR